MAVEVGQLLVERERACAASGDHADDFVTVETDRVGVLGVETVDQPLGVVRRMLRDLLDESPIVEPVDRLDSNSTRPSASLKRSVPVMFTLATVSAVGDFAPTCRTAMREAQQRGERQRGQPEFGRPENQREDGTPDEGHHPGSHGATQQRPRDSEGRRDHREHGEVQRRERADRSGNALAAAPAELRRKDAADRRGDGAQLRDSGCPGPLGEHREQTLRRIECRDDRERTAPEKPPGVACPGIATPEHSDVAPVAPTHPVVSCLIPLATLSDRRPSWSLFFASISSCARARNESRISASRAVLPGSRAG